jgi:hypothetical protein
MKKAFLQPPTQRIWHSNSAGVDNAIADNDIRWLIFSNNCKKACVIFSKGLDYQSVGYMVPTAYRSWI